MLELTAEQVAALAEIDAKRFVEGVRADLCKDDPKLADDATLPSRLWRAFKAAREIGVERDENLIGFLRVEAYSHGFYEQPAIRAWLTRPGRSADERFHDYMRVVRWHIEHPEFQGGLNNGGSGGSIDNGGSASPWSGLGALAQLYWAGQRWGQRVVCPAIRKRKIARPLNAHCHEPTGCAINARPKAAGGFAAITASTGIRTVTKHALRVFRSIRKNAVGPKSGDGSVSISTGFSPARACCKKRRATTINFSMARSRKPKNGSKVSGPWKIRSLSRARPCA